MKASRITSLFLAFVMLLSLPLEAFATDSVKSSTEREMDALDVLLVAHRYMSGTSDNVNIWSRDVSIRDLVELYDIDGEPMAYYIAFESGGYAIVSNNLKNPIPIEFGEGDNLSIREIVDNAKTSNSTVPPQICYVNPLFSFAAEQSSVAIDSAEKDAIREEQRLDEFYSILDTANTAEAVLHEAYRDIALSSMNTTRGGTYDFIDWNNMPSGSYSSDWLPFGGTSWAVMGNYQGTTNPISNTVVNNHCGATAATNLSLYFANQGYWSFQKHGSTNETFYDLHNRIGNGPVMTIAGQLSAYATSRGYALNHSPVDTYYDYEAAIANGRPCGVLLAAAIANWHWVVGIGYREYNTGAHYVRIVNGWDNSANIFYLWGSPVTLSISQYWM